MKDLKEIIFEWAQVLRFNSYKSINATLDEIEQSEYAVRRKKTLKDIPLLLIMFCKYGYSNRFITEVDNDDSLSIKPLSSHSHHFTKFHAIFDRLFNKKDANLYIIGTDQIPLLMNTNVYDKFVSRLSDKDNQYNILHCLLGSKNTIPYDLLYEVFAKVLDAFPEYFITMGSGMNPIALSINHMLNYQYPMKLVLRGRRQIEVLNVSALEKDYKDMMIFLKYLLEGRFAFDYGKYYLETGIDCLTIYFKVILKMKDFTFVDFDSEIIKKLANPETVRDLVSGAKFTSLYKISSKKYDPAIYNSLKVIRVAN
jgi:hypothetical protein